jgi:NAD(P)-dependent dehydrogenase (short-subunit alcohol dehydrogenase family)
LPEAIPLPHASTAPPSRSSPKHWASLGQADDIAAATLYLASDESAFVTGMELLVDGGYAQI